MAAIGRVGLAAALLLVAASLAGGPAAAGGERREKPVFADADREVGHSGEETGLFDSLGFGGDSEEGEEEDGEEKGIFDSLDFGFGGDDEGLEQDGTYLERFEPPAPGTYETLAEKRPVSLSIQRSMGYGLVSSPELNAYVDGILQRIVAVSPVPRLDVRALVRASNKYGAASTPDGLILVNMGMLQDVESEDELAAVLAHELAHVLYRHHGSDWFENSQKIAAQALSLKDYGEGAIDGVMPGEDSRKVLLTSFAGEISERVVAPNLWNREQEREADGLGVDLLIAAGYKSGAARVSLERLADFEARQRERAQRKLDEIAKSTQADMEAAVDSGDLSSIVIGLVETAGTVAGVAANKVIDAVGGGDHDPAEVRADRVDAYIASKHLFAPRPSPTAPIWRDGRHPTAAVLGHYLSARRADSALAEGKLDEAESLIRTAVSAPTKADAYPRLVFSELRQTQGDADKSYRNLEIAKEGREPAFVVYDMMIHRQLASGRPDDAVGLIDEAIRRLDEPPILLPYRIATLVSASKNVEATALFTKCKLTYPALAPECNRALGGLPAIAADESDEEPQGSATMKLIDRQTEKSKNTAATETGGQ